MPSVRYVVPGATSTAFTPVPAVTAAVLAYKQDVDGQPGTKGIAADRPGVNLARASTFRGYSGDSEMMPPVWYPQQWFEPVLSELPPVSIYSDNQMPVPAADPRGAAARLATPPVFLGQRQVMQGRGIPKWANWLPSASYGG